MVGFRPDPTDCPIDELPSLKPVLTMVGGRPAHDPEGLAAHNAGMDGQAEAGTAL
jgi:hypothetical protein